MKRIAQALTVAATIALMSSNAGAGYGSKQKDIVDTALAAGNFNTLATALTEAGLVEALKGDGPFTVFAPTDEAFAKLPKGTVESLLEPENRDKLIAVLKYHVVAGRLDASAVSEAKGAKTLNGQQLAFSAKKGNVMIGEAKVTAADVKAANGIIHVIDTVLLPPEQHSSADATESDAKI